MSALTYKITDATKCFALMHAVDYNEVFPSRTWIVITTDLIRLTPDIVPVI